MTFPVAIAEGNEPIFPFATHREQKGELFSGSRPRIRTNFASKASKVVLYFPERLIRSEGAIYSVRMRGLWGIFDRPVLQHLNTGEWLLFFQLDQNGVLIVSNNKEFVQF